MNWLILIALLFLIFIAFPILFIGAPFLPSFRKNKDIDFAAIFNLFKKEKIKTLIDLGSGDGRVIIEFAKNGFTANGIELNPLLVWWSKRKIKKSGLDKIAKVKLGNFWKTNLKNYDAVFIFQFKTANKILSKKFKEELKDGAIIISAGFPLEDFKLLSKINPFFIYKK